MLNPFPIQFLALLAYFILRVTVSIFLVRTVALQTTSYQHTPYPTYIKFIIGLELALTTFFLVGAYTQYAAIGLAILSVLMLIDNHKPMPVLQVSTNTALLLLGISLSLFITGAGAFAVDLPI